MNLALKHALIDRQVPEYKTAQDAEIHYSRLSKIIYELANPTREEKQRLSTILDRPIQELFPGKSENRKSGIDS